MPDKIGQFHVDDTITLPEKHDYGIGIIGCGGIVNYAHLPAYRKAGLQVIACYDQNIEAANKTASDHEIPTVCTSIEELLADPRIDIVDIAITPWAQAAVARQVIAAGKHLLCQKPFSDSFADALQVVEEARNAGVKLAVNQQMRWDSGIRVARQLIEQGAIGRPADARIEVSIRTPWHMWPWIASRDQLEIMFHSIHYQDSLRYLFGNPESVFSIHHKYPDQPETGETKTLTVFQYSDEFSAVIDVNHHNWSDDYYARFRFLGDGGIIEGTLGLLYDYPTGRVDTLRYQSVDDPKAWYDAKLSTWWIPDAFLGPMASLMDSIQTGEEPITAGEDNLRTLQTVFASYRSASEGRLVALSEIK